MKNNIIKIVIILIVIALIFVGIWFYNIENEEKIICTVDGDNVINEVVYEQNIIMTNIEVANQTDTNQNVEVDEVPGDMGEYYISIGKWQKFEFNTPVGEDGKFEIYAEKAVQARGFSGASAHIYYLRESEIFYHNQDGVDTKLASGITDLKIQGEDIIAVKGEDAKIYVENQYIQYK